ncbi:hypothetical protein [Bartonella sp. TP]|uniref:hypothetical protein n=1 Tax=Bartonella sp. TP TaxID=3057550 RepID=UPI0025B04F92|nr:hypothetical protein [Bartonella sp. TP]MDN5249040.1 hypothetical protein [Alphaproteobacteria bacterium]WJW80522.1 hypothetical protein QVL57_02850 [Bartonella sp. TP]
MQSLSQQYAKAIRHNKRVRIYRWLLLVCAVLVFVAFATAMLYPYIKRHMVAEFVVQKSLLQRMHKSSLMRDAKLKDYSRGAELYDFNVGEVVQDYSNKHVTKLKDISGRFILSSNSWLDLSTKEGVYDDSLRLFRLPGQISLTLDNEGAKIYGNLPNASIDVAAKSLQSTGGVKVNNDMMQLTAQALQISDSGKNLLFTGAIQLSLDDKKYGKITITADELRILPMLQLLHFSSHVMAKLHGDIVKSDMMQLHYLKASHDVDKIFASGHVYLKHNNEIARGCKLQMDVKNGTTKLDSCAVQASISLGN